MTTMTSRQWKPTEAQVAYVKSLFADKVPATAPNRDQFWENIKSVSSNEGLTTVINNLKSLPAALAPVRTVEMVQDNGIGKTVPFKPVLPVLATEDGLYRNPADGTLYRLTTPAKRNSWDRPQTIVSVYSNKAVYRRLTPEGRMVKKGKWTRKNARESRYLLGYTHAQKNGFGVFTPGTKVEASWIMTDEDKVEWAVGFCMFCSKPLIDAVSVWNSIGPKCAKDHGVTLETPPEA